jgi:hypothetical protein
LLQFRGGFDSYGAAGDLMGSTTSHHQISSLCRPASAQQVGSSAPLSSKIHLISVDGRGPVS